MITRLWRGGTRPLTLLMVAALIFGAVPSPAEATGTDVAHTPPAHTTVSASLSGYDVNSACNGATTVLYDANDATCRGAGQDNLYTESQNGFYVRFALDGSAAPMDLLSFRLLWGICQYGYSWGHGGCSTNADYGNAPTLTHWYIYCDDTSGSVLSDPLVYDSGTVSIAGGSVGAIDTGQLDLTTPCSINTSETRGLFVKYTTNSSESWGSGQAAVVSSFEAYTVLNVEEVDISNYVYNLRMYHPPFVRRISWEWIEYPVWGGAWELTDSDDTLLYSGFAHDAHFVTLDIQCLPVCGEDTYTLTVHDATNSRVAYYDIDGDADGLLSGDIGAPYLGPVTFCYQATSAQCDAVITTVGLVKVVYSFTTLPSTPEVEYYISAGQLSATLPAPNMSSVGVSGTHVPGSYTLYFEADTDLRPFAVLLIAGGGGQRTFAVSPELDFGAGGTVGVQPQPLPGTVPPPCAQFDVVCGLQSLFGIASGAIYDKFVELNNAILQRQPFAFIIGSGGAIRTQITRAQAAVVSSSTCAGVHFTMPTLPPVAYTAFGANRTANPQYYAYNGNVPSPTPFAFSAVRCEDIEPWGGSSWWQAIRTIMGPALVMGYAFQLFKRYEVKPVISG